MTPDTAGFASFNAAAERFAAAARTFFEGAADASAPIAAEAARTFSDFLREQFATFQQPWHAAFGPGAGAPAASIADLPALGATREHQQRWQRAADAWQHIEEAQRRLQRLWSDALREASVAFAARLGAPQPADAGADALRKLYDLWIDCAEDAYARTAHGEAFCSALSDLVNASSRLRNELQASVEQWAKTLDLPTRSEINTLARRLRLVEEQLHNARNERTRPAGHKAPITAARKRKAAGARKPKGAPGKARRTSRKARP
jgi:hypothetical protein